jgi:hypothetical protein
MTVEEVLANIEQYKPQQQEAIRLAVATQSGEVLELMIQAIVGE